MWPQLYRSYRRRISEVEPSLGTDYFLKAKVDLSEVLMSEEQSVTEVQQFCDGNCMIDVGIDVLVLVLRSLP